jgi:hypothetical protein
MNKDKSVVIVAQNESPVEKVLRVKVGNKMISPLLKADSFNTIFIK